MLSEAIKYITRNEYMYFMAYPNVVAVGYGNKYINNINSNKLCIQVFVKKKWLKCCNKCQGAIPKYYKGIPTDVIESGSFFSTAGNMSIIEETNNKQSEPFSYQNAFTDKMRPVKMGYSIAPDKATNGGTAGCIVTRKMYKGTRLVLYVLSTNSVLANKNELPKGTYIVQPFKGDRIKDSFGFLADYIPIKFITPQGTPQNYVDAATVFVLTASLITPQIALMNIPKGIDINPKLDEELRKSGAGTGYTKSKIISETATATITYNDGKKAYYVDQIIVEGSSKTGDAGAIYLNKNDEAVGMNIGMADNHSLLNKIANIEKLLNVKVFTQK